MATIRIIEITRFRAIEKLQYYPSPGINCLIGPGDSGKSTILDAVEACLGGRRNPTFSDTDFHLLNVAEPIEIKITLGALDSNYTNIEKYGPWLRAFEKTSGAVENEPRKDWETVLTVCLTVNDSLEPIWTLYSEKPELAGVERILHWSERQSLAPTRLGANADYNLSWKKGSLITKLTEEQPKQKISLIEAGRNARAAFDAEVENELSEPLEAVDKIAGYLGLGIGTPKAMLDINSVSFTGGTISLHGENGVPLSNMGLGSKRLLTAGMQRQIAEHANLIIIDEIEHGLEPHRIIHFLEALGSNEQAPPLQVFMTTHSPVVIRELKADQLFILRQGKGHTAIRLSAMADIQGTIRTNPEVFLAKKILVCEGASEIGILRGLDNSLDKRFQSLNAHGVGLVDGTGTDMVERAKSFCYAGFETALFRDSDVIPPKESELVALGATIFSWKAGHSTEMVLFRELPDEAVERLVDYAVEAKGKALVDEHVKTASSNKFGHSDVFLQNLVGTGYDAERRETLVIAATYKNQRAWFKNITAMEYIAEHIMLTNLSAMSKDTNETLAAIFDWVKSGSG